MVTETAIHLEAPSPAGDLCSCPQDVRGLAGDGPVLRGWDQGWWKHPSLPTSWCLSGPIQGHLTPPPSHPVREGQAIQDRWVSHIAAPQGYMPRQWPTFAVLASPPVLQLGVSFQGQNPPSPWLQSQCLLPLFPCPFMHPVPLPASG